MSVARFPPPPKVWAEQLGVSTEAIELYLASEVIDLHLDSFIWTRLLGYDLGKRHGAGLFGGRFYSQADLPRMLAAGIGGAMWSITTNPWRGAEGRARVLAENIAHIQALFSTVGDRVQLVKNEREYRAARSAGLHAAMLAVQGGNALELDSTPLSELVRVTVVHMTRSIFGTSSAPSPLPAAGGLSERGREFIALLNRRRIFVDLAHMSRQAFFDSVAVHDRSQPLIVTHTGVSGVHPSWRNIDDAQIRCVADTGGVVGVVFHGEYLSGHYFGGGRIEAIVDHLLHIVNVAGPNVPALGSDWDGAIIPPKALRSCEQLPRLVQALLDRKVPHATIQKLLGENFLRAFAQLRP